MQRTCQNVRKTRENSRTSTGHAHVIRCRSTGFPQARRLGQNGPVPSFVRCVVIAAIVIAWNVTGAAQSVVSKQSTTYRVFLASGEPLPSYGEPVVVGDRVIFNLLVGEETDGSANVQLVSLPVSGVDSERTLRYAEAMRAAHYAATRGETDYAALTAEVARVLEQLATITEPRRRLALAEEARRQLLAWSEQHYQYRAADIHELARLFEGVITELRIAAGEPAATFELIARPPSLEPLLPPPTLRESVALALSAARVADIGSDRVDILRRATESARRMDDNGVEATVSTALAEEVKAGTAYAALTAALRERADNARRRGDVAAVERITRELERQDEALGRRRPAEVQELQDHLDRTLEATRAFRAALDAHTRQLSALRRYDTALRPLLDRFDALGPVLTAVREMRGLTSSQIDLTDAAILRLGRDLDTIRPPAAQGAVHVTFQNVLRIAHESLVRRRRARSSQSAEMREASAAASGALLLAGQVRRDLASSLRRPTIQ